VAARPAGKQAELQRNWENFKAMPAERQAEIKALVTKLNGDPKRKQLWEIESRYRQWYLTLQKPQQTELLALNVSDRVKQIAKSRQLPLTANDLLAVAKWFEEQIDSRRDELMSGRELREMEDRDVREQKFHLRMRADRKWQINSPDGEPPFRRSDYEQLEKELSTKAKSVLAAAETRQEKWRVVQRWIWPASFFSYLITETERDELRELRGEEFSQQLHNLMSQRAAWRPPGERPPGERPPGDGTRERDRRRGDERRRRGPDPKETDGRGADGPQMNERSDDDRRGPDDRPPERRRDRTPVDER
jgi:hypothetical protein